MKTWFAPNALFKRDEWNHFKRYCGRTDNHLEGFHLGMKKDIKEPHPNIHRFIQSIGEKHTNFYKKFLKLSGGHRKSKDKKRDEDFNTLYRESIRMYEESGETFTAASRLLENIAINSIVSNPVTRDNEPDEIAEVEDEIVADDVIQEAEVVPDE